MHLTATFIAIIILSLTLYSTQDSKNSLDNNVLSAAILFVTPTSSITPTPNISTPTPLSNPSSHLSSGNSDVTSSQAIKISTFSDVQILANKDYVLKAINDHRVSKGLSVLNSDSYTCNFAKLRALEISNNFNHDGFNNRINNKTLPYSSYSSITENIAMNSNYKEVANTWINSPPHALNLEKDANYACVGNTNDYYVFESWKR